MRVIPIATLMVISTCRAWAANAPSRLYGKTISVSSTENLMWRPAGAQVFTHREKTSHLIVYVSGSGRLFVRTWVQHGGSAVTVYEQVGASGRSNIGGARTAQFAGRSLVTTTAFQGAATRHQIDFDANFGSCSVSIIVGKEAGANTSFQMRGMGGTSLVEIQSETHTNPTCSIEEGNAFAR